LAAKLRTDRDFLRIRDLPAGSALSLHVTGVSRFRD
jgi:hypothetical protein